MPSLKRCLLIALMLVLLPLRGWAGNVMAIDMTAANAALASLSHQTVMTDCVMHAQAATDEAAAVCGNCDTCELCLLVVNLTPAPWTASPLTRHSSPLALNASYNSATSATHLKPPIF